MQNIPRLLAAGLLGIVAFTLVLVITDPPGPGLDPDALSYMGAAESVALHGEYRIPLAKWASPDSTEPLAHFPPAYPTVLALPLRLGMTPSQGARLVSAVAAFITITTLVLLVGAVASMSGGVLLAVALFAMTSMHEVHLSVLSEPLYLACMVLVLAAMVLAPDRPLRAGIPAAVGVMTRYAGASLVGAVALWALLQPGTRRDRARRAAIALLPALLLQAVWVLRTRAEAGTGEIRKFALYGNLGSTFAQGGRTLIAWLIPYTAGPKDALPYRTTLALAAGCALALLAGIGAWRAWLSARAAREDGDQQPVLAWRVFCAASLLIVCYAGVVGASRILADPEIPLDQRMLAPALVLVMAMFAVGLTLWWCSTRLELARVAVALALAAWWNAAALATRADSRYVMRWGSDFAGEQWRDSELLAWARTAGADKPLYTNWPAAVYFYLHRPSHEIPQKGDARTMAAFADTLRARGGRVLLFNVGTELLAPNDSLLNAPGLQTIAEFRDGVVMRSDP